MNIARRAMMLVLAVALVPAAAPASVSLRSPTTPIAPIQVCERFTAADVSAALKGPGLAVEVGAGQPGYAYCRYPITGGGARTVMIDAIQADSEADARRQYRELVAAVSGRPLAGIGDESVLVDDGPYGTYSVKYRSGRVLGQVNIRADGTSLEAAAIALAQRWVQALGGSAAGETVVTASEPADEPATEPATASVGLASGEWERVPDEARRSLPPLPPLRWPDADSAARARGLATASPAPVLPPNVAPAIHASRTVRSATGMDTLFSADAFALVEQQMRELMRKAEAGARPDLGAMQIQRASSAGTFVYGSQLPRSASRGPNPAMESPFRLSLPAIASTPVAAPRPKWFRESETFESAAPARLDGAAVSGRGVVTRYMEPWRRGTAMTLETSYSQTAKGGSGVLTERQRWEVSTDICPAADGIVKGRGTFELASEVQIQDANGSRVLHATATNHFTVTVRVNDDAIPVSLDIQHSVEGRESGSDGAEKHWITEAAQTSVDPGISVDAMGNTTRDHTSSDGTLHTENLLSTDGTSKMIAASVVLASSYVKNSVEEAFNEWWGGSCLEVRSRRQPDRSRLRAGESADFELEVFHYQDDDVVALPVTIEEPDDPAQGTVAPTVSTEGPARFTFTAPSGSSWEAWRQAQIRSQSTSRRGRANVPAEGPTFSRRNEREYISITVRDRTSTERLGDVYDIVFTFTLTPDETDPEMLRSAGSFSGTIVGNDANCLDGHDTPSNPEPVQGRVQEEAVGYVAELNGRRSLHFSVTGDLPPLEGLERNVSFMLLEGIPLPAPGSAPVTYRRVVPFGFTGVIPECSGAVESISEVTISSSLEDG